MTITYATDHAAFESAIANWLAIYAIQNNRVRQADFEAVKPNTPFATFQIIADSAMGGIDSEDTEYNADTNRLDVSNSGQRLMTVQVVIYTTPGVADLNQANARIMLNRALASLRNTTVREAFNIAGLAFIRLLDSPRQTDEQIGPRWERRMQVDLEFGYTSLLLDQSLPNGTGGQSWIETVVDTEVTYE